MSEKKAMSRRMFIALGIACIVLIAGIGAIWLRYSVQDMEKDEKINLLQTYLDGNKTLLSQTQTWLNGNITYYSSQITNLQNQLSNFTKPLLGFSDLTAEDNRSVPETPYLHINGTLNNFGIERTTLGYLTVEAYQNNGQIAIQNDTSFWSGINGQSSKKVDLKIPYNGSALTSWTITLLLTIFI